MANGPTTPAKEVVGTTAALNDFARRVLQCLTARLKRNWMQKRKLDKRDGLNVTFPALLLFAQTGTLERLARPSHLAGQFCVSQSLP